MHVVMQEMHTVNDVPLYVCRRIHHNPSRLGPNVQPLSTDYLAVRHPRVVYYLHKAILLKSAVVHVYAVGNQRCCRSGR